MRRATWRVPAKSQEDPNGERGQRVVEYRRAYCAYRCGGAVGHWWWDLNDLPGAFRLPLGVVYNHEHQLWELSKRASRQRRLWRQEGRPLDEWKPSPRRALSTKALREQADIFDGPISGGEPLIPGVVATLPVENGMPCLVVDPALTGGIVVVRCPQCGWPNEVGPPQKDS